MYCGYTLVSPITSSSSDIHDVAKDADNVLDVASPTLVKMRVEMSGGGAARGRCDGTGNAITTSPVARLLVVIAVV